MNQFTPTTFGQEVVGVVETRSTVMNMVDHDSNSATETRQPTPGVRVCRGLTKANLYPYPRVPYPQPTRVSKPLTNPSEHDYCQWLTNPPPFLSFSISFSFFSFFKYLVK